MKDVLEEYGGVIAAAVVILIILTLIGTMFQPDGAFQQIAWTFFQGVGAVKQ